MSDEKYTCDECGSENTRLVNRSREGGRFGSDAQTVKCLNPKCGERWTV